MKRIRAAADVSQVEKWEAQLGASGGINIQKRRTREGGAVRSSVEKQQRFYPSKVRSLSCLVTQSLSAIF